jgi:hypothetical protein
VVQASSKTTSTSLPNTHQKKSYKSDKKKPHRKMSGASTGKNNFKNIVQKSLNTKTLGNRITKPHQKNEWCKHHTKQPQKHCPKTSQQKHIHKSHKKATSKKEWCKHHTKQLQKHCPKATNKNTLGNRTKKPLPQISGAGNIKNNLKNIAQKPTETQQ